MNTQEEIVYRLNHDDTVKIGSHTYIRLYTDFNLWLREDGYIYTDKCLLNLANQEGMYI